jgi:CubicO group peptidase (beta-lactamase class C family)
MTEWPDIDGVEPGFEPVRDQFDEYIRTDPTFSAQLVAIWKGRPIVDLAGGPDLDKNSLTGVFSVSKGVAAIAFSRLVDTGAISLSAPIAHYWPEFGLHGKGEILVRELLSHQAGLVNSSPPLTGEDVIDSERAAAKLAESHPIWRPGSSFGYHGLTIGVFMEELVRRVTGDTLQQLYELDVRAPRDIDFYLGLPEAQDHRYRPVAPMVLTAEQQAEMAAAAPPPDGLMALALDTLPGGGSAAAAVFPHSQQGRRAGFSAVGGVGSARGIASVYAAALGQWGKPLCRPSTLRDMTTELVFGIDRVLTMQMAFATVFMKPQPRIPFGSYLAFGHDGMGGALGFADPMYDLAFGYIPLPMQYPGGADARAIELSAIVRSCIRSESKR